VGALHQRFIKRLYKPEYFYRPSQLVRRFSSALSGEIEPATLRLSWGTPIKIKAGQTIGRSIRSFGVYDLALSEFIFRVVRKHDVLLDVGANVGYTSLLMAERLEGTGRLISFEPLPELFQVLCHNIPHEDFPQVELRELALSDKGGEAILTLPPDFEKNDGIATLEERNGGTKIKIQTARLDDLNFRGKIRLIKLDVEGHELAVLRGGVETIRKSEVDFILYEDLGHQTAEVTNILNELGYKVFKLVKGFKGLRLEKPDYPFTYSYDPDNYVALRDMSVVHEINARPNWKLLRWKKERA
jgi:FkbM family methyltransferase